MWIEPLKENLIILEEKVIKNTARCPLQYVLADSKMKKYLLVIGKTEVQKFYIRRAILYQEEWYAQFSKYSFRLNAPIYCWEEKNELKVLYYFFDDVAFTKNNRPLEYINEIYANDAKILVCTDENIRLILDSFLDTWPPEYHKSICELPLYKKLRDKIASQHSLMTCLEHGDYTINNILMRHSGDIYLMDFEFAKRNQPIGMDKMDFMRTNAGKCRKTDYYGINKIKYELMEEINYMVDGMECPKSSFASKLCASVKYCLRRKCL